MLTLISILLFSIFAFLSGLHFYWAIGGRWGSAAVFPSKDEHTKPIMPGIIPTLIVAIGLLAIAIFILSRAQLFYFPSITWLDSYGLSIIAGLFILRAIGDFKYVGFFKNIRSTAFARQDTKYYSPLCLIIGGLTLVLVFSR